ncbi:MAG: hypothetical protein NUW07_06455 [Candidatus Saccharicenans sp.]|nr:hypothetical protein [Candidatus Saccharicenans sp.]
MVSKVKVNLRRSRTIASLGLISGLLLLTLGLNIGFGAQDRGEEILKKVEVQTIGDRAPADIQAEMVKGVVWR